MRNQVIANPSGGMTKQGDLLGSIPSAYQCKCLTRPRPEYSLFAGSAKSRAGHPSLTERRRAFLHLEILEDRQLLSGATFVNTDLTTQGNWRGMYGKDGYN